MQLASHIREFISQNKMNAIMVNASIGTKPFMVFNNMTEKDILDKRKRLLSERDTNIIKDESEKI